MFWNQSKVWNSISCTIEKPRRSKSNFIKPKFHPCRVIAKISLVYKNCQTTKVWFCTYARPNCFKEFCFPFSRLIYCVIYSHNSFGLTIIPKMWKTNTLPTQHSILIYEITFWKKSLVDCLRVVFLYLRENTFL